MFRVTKCYDNQLLKKFENELLVFPDWISKCLIDSGFSLQMHRDQLTINGVVQKWEADYLQGRDPSKTTCVRFPENILYMINEHNRTEKEREFSSTIRHEVSHAIDWFLGKGFYWSEENPEMLVEPLDDYAAINPREQFAQALEGFFQSENKKDASFWKYWHTRDEVYKKEPKLFDFFNQLLKENGNCFNV
jgi:hypothetical protein